MQSRDKVDQLKASIQARREAEEKTASHQGQGLSVGLEEVYQKKIAELESTLEKTEAQLQETQNKAKEEQERYIRLFAEFENFRKRSHRDQDEARRQGLEKLVKEILPVIDGLEKALEHAQQSEDQQAIVKGVDLVLKQFLKTMESFGIRPVESKGQPFDPNIHEAMGHHETEDHEPDTVVQEYRRGYLYNERLLRPALVTVAKPVDTKK